ncbi:MAG: ABC transporter ATP-binding protein [Acidimicrobiales bacterium]
MQGLYAGYGRKQVVFDVDLHVGVGEVVTILGHNGAGKTTTLKTVFGMLPAQGGRVRYRGEDITRASCRHNVLAGMSLIPSERFVFGDLTVSDNLSLGGLHERSADVRAERLERVYAMFPILSDRSGQEARTMSGGEQRMLSLGVAVMAGPRLLMLDEPSLGLAPSLVQMIFEAIRGLATTEALSVLLLEQNIGNALRITDRVYVMRSGRIILEETAEQMRAREQYWDLF